jgi:lipopolysaccharide biosynthesis glycosyltransferase
MKSSIPLYVGYDQREAAAYHVFSQSVIERSSVPVSFHPLHKEMLNGFDWQRDGSNAFLYSRFLPPFFQSYQGWALFADGDMVCLEDIAKLWELRDDRYAVMVVKHDYQTKNDRKYVGTEMESANTNYPRKNWSSVVLWNCGHPANRILTPEFISQSPGSLMHRFGWLKDDQIGELPVEWNTLVGEQDIGFAHLLHFTLGIPKMKYYQYFPGADHWHRAYRNATFCAGD